MSLELTLGWSLVHSVWEIAAIGASLLLFLLAARRANAQTRYAAALVALVMCAAAPPVTLALLSRPLPQVATLATASVKEAAPKPETAPTMAIAALPPELPQGLGPRIEAGLPVVVNLWLAGLALMCARLLGGLVGIWRLKRSGYPDAGGQLQAMAEAVGRKLNLQRRFALLLSNRVEVPTVIGAFKSVILLPATLTLRLSPAQIEALLAHEIAHIRRYDYLVNLLQSAIEAVLFYHPAVWWISSVVRREREHCCDDIAIETLGDRIGYTQALVSLEEARSGHLALAANGSGLLARVRRIAGTPLSKPEPRSSVLTALAVALIPLGLLCRTGFARQEPMGGTMDVKGQVIRADGRPLAGAFVNCAIEGSTQIAPHNLQQTTDSQGRYDFRIEKGAHWKIAACSARYGIGWTVKGPALKLRPPSPGRVQVVDQSGRPVAHLTLVPSEAEIDGMGIWLGSLADQYTFETDARGMATLTSLPAKCKATFDVVDGNYIVDRSPGILSKDQLERIVVHAGCRVSGTVTADGKPVADVFVDVNGVGRVGRPGTTDAQGRFEVEAVPAGPALITTSLYRGKWAVAPKRLIVSREHANIVQLTAQKTGTASGRVLDAVGKPLPQTIVQIYEGMPLNYTSAHQISSREDGSFSINLLPGSYSAEAGPDIAREADPNFARGAKAFIVQADQTTSVTIRVAELAAPPITTLRCKLLDPNGRPVLRSIFWFIFRSGNQSSVELVNSRDQGTAEVSGPAKLKLPVTFHCVTKRWESDELTWRSGAVLTIHLHRKGKGAPSVTR